MSEHRLASWVLPTCMAFGCVLIIVMLLSCMAFRKAPPEIPDDTTELSKTATNAIGSGRPQPTKPINTNRLAEGGLIERKKIEPERLQEKEPNINENNGLKLIQAASHENITEGPATVIAAGKDDTVKEGEVLQQDQSGEKNEKVLQQDQSVEVKEQGSIALDLNGESRVRRAVAKIDKRGLG